MRVWPALRRAQDEGGGRGEVVADPTVTLTPCTEKACASGGCAAAGPRLWPDPRWGAGGGGGGGMPWVWGAVPGAASRRPAVRHGPAEGRAAPIGAVRAKH